MKVGDRVFWESQSGGFVTRKEGTILWWYTKAATLRDSEAQRDACQQTIDAFRQRRGNPHTGTAARRGFMFDATWPSLLSEKRGALIEVQEGTQKPKLYAPFRSTLRLVAAEPAVAAPSLTLVFIVNGEEIAVPARLGESLAEARNRALVAAKNTGRPLNDWQICDETGWPLASDQPIGNFNFEDGARLYLSLNVGAGG